MTEEIKTDALTEEQPGIPLEDRLLSLENQGYISYLMINALIKILSDAGIVNKDDLAKEMDDLNEKLYQLTKELVQTEEPTVE